jgi:hypothetical protein
MESNYAQRVHRTRIAGTAALELVWGCIDIRAGMNGFIRGAAGQM